MALSVRPFTPRWVEPLRCQVPLLSQFFDISEVLPASRIKAEDFTGSLVDTVTSSALGLLGVSLLFRLRGSFSTCASPTLGARGERDGTDPVPRQGLDWTLTVISFPCLGSPFPSSSGLGCVHFVLFYQS